MIGTTHRQAELLAFIDRYQRENDGVAPSFEEMKFAVGLRAKSGVHRLLKALEERGLIRRLSYRARAIEILPDTGVLAHFTSGELIDEVTRRVRRSKAA